MTTPYLLTAGVPPPKTSFLDEAWKASVVVGVGIMAHSTWGGSSVTQHGIGDVPWFTLACIAVLVMSATSVLGRNIVAPLVGLLDRMGGAFRLIAYIACIIGIVGVVCFFGFLGFMFMLGGPQRSDQVASRMLAVCDALLSLLPHTQS